MTVKNYCAALTILGGFLFSGGAHAAPIAYEGELLLGETVVDQVNQDSSEGDWWSFEAVAGQTYVLTGHRLEAALDPAFDLYFGFGDTDDLVEIGFADDDIPTLPGLEGPFSDPQLIFTAEFTGTYSLYFWSFLSDDPGQDGVYDYQLSFATFDVPEPAALGLLGLGLLGLGALRRRRA